MGTVTRLAARRPHTVTLPSQAVAEVGIEVTQAAIRLAAFMDQLASANRGRPHLVRRLEESQRDARDLVATGRWLCHAADGPEPERRAA